MEKAKQLPQLESIPAMSDHAGDDHSAPVNQATSAQKNQQQIDTNKQAFNNTNNVIGSF